MSRRVLVVLGASVVLATLAWLAQGRARDFGALQGIESAPETAPHDAYVLEQLALATTRGRRLSCLLRLPARAAAGATFPALLVAGGRRTGRRAVVAVDTAFGGVALACDYPWSDASKLSWPAFVLRLPRSRAEVVATPQALGVAASYLLSRGDVDTSRFVGVGASLGVPPVAAWAARDTRPRAVVLLYGGGDLGAILANNMQSRIRPAWLRGGIAELLGWTLRPLEPLRAAPRIAPRPLLVVAAADDTWIPVRSVERLYAAAREPKQMLWLRGEHLATRDAELLRILTDSILGWASAVLPARNWRARPR